MRFEFELHRTEGSRYLLRTQVAYLLYAFRVFYKEKGISWWDVAARNCLEILVNRFIKNNYRREIRLGFIDVRLTSNSDTLEDFTLPVEKKIKSSEEICSLYEESLANEGTREWQHTLFEKYKDATLEQLEEAVIDDSYQEQEVVVTRFGVLHLPSPVPLRMTGSKWDDVILRRFLAGRLLLALERDGAVFRLLYSSNPPNPPNPPNTSIKSRARLGLVSSLSLTFQDRENLKYRSPPSVRVWQSFCTYAAETKGAM